MQQTRCASARLLDHLVGASEHGGRYVEAEGLSSLEVDGQFVLGGRLHRQVSRFFSLENAVNVAGRRPVLTNQIRPIGNQAAVCDEEAVAVDGGQSVAGRQRDDQMAMKLG